MAMSTPAGPRPVDLRGDSAADARTESIHTPKDSHLFPPTLAYDPAGLLTRQVVSTHKLSILVHIKARLKDWICSVWNRLTPNLHEPNQAVIATCSRLLGALASLFAIFSLRVSSSSSLGGSSTWHSSERMAHPHDDRQRLLLVILLIFLLHSLLLFSLFFAPLLFFSLPLSRILSQLPL